VVECNIIKLKVEKMKSIASKKVLITGGTGYIGNYVTKMLAASHPEI
jgi:FlaA1/EpsC-like NDP-sugar epimerase